MNILRHNKDTYQVGGVFLERTPLKSDYLRLDGSYKDGIWVAFVAGDAATSAAAGRGPVVRPMFMADTLEDILELAAGAVELMRPADG